MHYATINPEHLQLCAVTHRLRSTAQAPRARFAAMSSGRWTPSNCGQRFGAAPVLPRPPLMAPMDRGLLLRAVERTRLQHGLDEVRRTWGTGLKALRAELGDHLLRRTPATTGAAQ